MKTHIRNLAVLLVLFAGFHQAAAQGTSAFTYQGQLHDSSTNANGTYGMTFKLYDAPASGAQIGSTILNSPTLVNGLFTVNLDFGAGAFNGAARWLDIAVQAGTNTAETLAPRVQILPTPYAQFAAVAATVTNGAIMNSQLAGSAVNSTNIAGGQVVKNINGLSDSVTLAAGVNTVLTTIGNSLFLSAQVPKMQVFTTSGTFTVPTNGVNKIMVEMWGGGGGGGGYNEYTVESPPSVFTIYYRPGGGGGAGAYAFNRLTVTPGASYTVTVGGGGYGAATGYAGQPGGTTSFDVLMSAGGGGGGGHGTTVSGQGGASGSANNSAAFFGGGGGEGGEDIRGGRGGSAVRGGCGGWDASYGESPGGGGGGGTDLSHPGGYGANGAVIISY